MSTISGKCSVRTLLTSSPVSVGMLLIDGARVMELAGESPGPRIGLILHALLESVLDDPARNDKELLEQRVKELAALPSGELEAAGKKGKAKREEEEEREISETLKMIYDGRINTSGTIAAIFLALNWGVSSRRTLSAISGRLSGAGLTAKVPSSIRETLRRAFTIAVIRSLPS